MSDNIVKSPSDTTIYVPALKHGKRVDDVVNKISDFVESIHIESTRKDKHNQGDIDSGIPLTNDQPDEESHTRHRNSTPDRYARSSEEYERKKADRADKIILEAKKFRANIAALKGTVSDASEFDFHTVTEEIKLRHLLDNDDDFFHVTCHVDPQLKEKIEAGQFVELEKLLPREGGSSLFSHNDTTFNDMLQVITKGGNTYLGAPQERDCKINSVRHWEQAFRVYAAIYTEAHPARAAKIWQYVYTNNTAATNYQWDNMYFYDQTFRRLMESKPWRSWSKTYTQGWNLAMHESMTHSVNVGNGNSNSKPVKDWRDDCCWKYNKNHCSKANNNCNYDHRCTYCGGWNHGFHNCRK